MNKSEKNKNYFKNRVMKRIVLNFLVIVSIAVSAAFTSCTGKITMKAETDSVGFLLKGEGNATVNWGNGKRETLSIDNDGARFDHDYSGKSLRTVTITGKNITVLECQGNELVSLNFSKNKTLKELNCNSCRLTSLDVSKNVALIRLYCMNNNLTGSALDALFKTLHSNYTAETKMIYITYNPGINDCTMSIAMDKGWMIWGDRKN